MARSDASADPLAQSNGGHHHLTGAEISDGQDPLTAAFPGDHPAADGGRSIAACTAQQRLHGVPKTSRSTQSVNGSVVKENGCPWTPAPSSTVVSDSQRLTKCHLACSHLPPSPPCPPALCCQQCHFRSALACPCGQQECPLLRTPSTGLRSGSVPQHGSTSACPCCLSACTYSHQQQQQHHTHPAHTPPPLCLHHHHHHQQRWQDHLQNQAPGIRYVGRLKRMFGILMKLRTDSQGPWRSVLVFQAPISPLPMPPYVVEQHLY